MATENPKLPHRTKSLKTRLKEYSEETTLHGLKYVAADDTFTLRRLAWIIVLLTASSIVTFFIVTKLRQYYEYPTITDIGMEYQDQMDFPAVVVCNQNPLRMVELFNEGTYDVVTNAYRRKYNTFDDEPDGCTEDYLLLDDVCSIPMEAVFKFDLIEVSKAVCEHTCTNLEVTRCSGYLYNFDSKKCTLTSYTGELSLQANDTCEGTRSLFFRRVRCLKEQTIQCSFEKGDSGGCPFEPYIFETERWAAVSGRDSIVSIVDHTRASEDGHFLALLPTTRRAGRQAIHQAPFIDTTGKCIMLFYMHLGSGVSELEVTAFEENLHENTLFVKTGSESAAWTPIFARLPGGIQRILIRGTRKTGNSGIAVDDIQLGPCAALEGECLFSFTGSEYLGKASHSSSGKPCLPWVKNGEYSQRFEHMFTDGSAEKAKDHCRNPDARDSGPWCFTDEAEQESCRIPYCDCGEQSVTCKSTGRCLPQGALCDGKFDCEDGSDETNTCEDRMHLECDFEEPFKCGYVSYPSTSFAWERRSGETWSKQTFLVFDDVVNNFYMHVTHGINSRYGDTAVLKSVEHVFPQESVVSFYVKMKVSEGDFATKLNVRLMSPLGTVSNTILSVKQRSDSLWVKYYVAVPAGIYTIVFEAIRGRSDNFQIALDSVAVVQDFESRKSEYEYEFSYDDVDYADSSEYLSTGEELFGVSALLDKLFDFQTELFIPTVTKLDSAALNTLIGSADTLTCSFNPNANCTEKYVNRPESQFYQWTIVPKDSLRLDEGSPAHQHQGCGGDYYEMKGVVESPGFPTRYFPNLNCSYTIHQPRGSNMTLFVKWFEVEDEIGCPYDSLQVRGELTCGNTSLHRSIHTNEEELRFSFISDQDYEYTGFQLVYSTTAVESVDYVMAAGFHMGLSSRSYRSRLFSPTFMLYETHCLVFDAYIATDFEVKLVERQEKERPYILLLKTSGLGAAWHRISLTLPVGGENSGVPMHVVFNSFHPGPPIYTTALDNILLARGGCEKKQGSKDEVGCDFSSIHQCGYVDISEGPLRWTRRYRQQDSNDSGSYSMSCVFPKQFVSNPSRLLTPTLTVTREMCLFLNLTSEGGFTTVSVGRHYKDGSTDKLTALHGDDMNTNNVVTVSLPLGQYKVVFGAIGQDSTTNLHRVWVKDIECNSTGQSYKNDSLQVDDGENNTTHVGSISNTNLTARSVVSNLTSAEIRETTFKRILQLIDIPLTDFLEATSMKQDISLLRCSYHNESTCPPEYLTMGHTDLGYCLFFNVNQTKPLRTTKSGVEGGLRMLLNIGEYNAIQEIGAGLGIKVRVLSQTKAPNLRDKGFIIGPGMRASASLTYTKISAMASPYGNCGERDLPHYPNSKYYHWKCQRDCEAFKLERKCGCRAIYMPEYQNYPVCSTNTYLDCVIQDDNSSSVYHCENCPADCNREEYDVQLSYSEISETMVNTAIADSNHTIHQSLISASTTQGRMKEKEMSKVLRYIDILLAYLTKTGIMLSDDVFGLYGAVHVFDRVKRGINAVVSSARNDVEEVLFGRLNQQINAYRRFLVGNHTLYINIGDETTHSLDYLARTMERRITGRDLDYQKALELCIDPAKTWLLKTEQYFGYPPPGMPSTDTPEVQQMLLPVNVFGSKSRVNKCNDHIEDFQESMSYISIALENLHADSVERFNDTALLIANITTLKETWQSARECLLHYGSFLARLDTWIKDGPLPRKTNTTKERLVSMSLYGDISDYTQQVRRAYQLFANNVITKLTLPGWFAYKQKQDILPLLDNLRLQIQQHLSNPMKTALIDTEIALTDYYRSSFNFLAEMSPFYDFRAATIMRRAQGVKLWKKPHASLENPDILSYLLRDEDRYDSQVYSGNRLSAQSDTDIVDYLTHYTDGLLKPLEDLDTSLLENVEQLRKTFTDLHTLLNEHRSIAEVDESFIKDNIIELSVYFPELKVSSVNQEKGYDIGAFFGDVGGYMGLLLGASVITVFEVLDLFLNHFFGKYFRKDSKVQDTKNQNFSQERFDNPGFSSIT